MTTLRFTRDGLIESLEARRAWAEKLDADRLAGHRKAEQDALKAFRAKCRRAVKLSYDELHAEGNWRGFEVRKEFPACPRSAVAQLDRALATVRATRQKTMAVSPAGQWRAVHWLLTHDETIVEDLCEADR